MMKKRKLKKDRKKSWQIFQKHHLEYGPNPPEKTVKITRTEHFFASRMETYFKAHGWTMGIKKTFLHYFKKYPKNKLR